MARTLIFVDHAPALGGAERSLLLLLHHLDRERFAPELACAGGPLAGRARELGVPVHLVPLARLRGTGRGLVRWAAGARALRRLARQRGAALLVANTVRAALYTAAAGVPWVWHMRDFWLSEARPRHLWADRLGKRLLCASARGVLANSRAVAAALPCPGRVAVVHNGVEVGEFDPALDGGPFRLEHRIPPAAPLVGVVGRLRPWKGQDRFLRAMARAAGEVPGLHLAVVGGDIFPAGSCGGAGSEGYAAHLRSLAGELGLGERVAFTGQLDDVRRALAAMDVFVHPGDPEPFGLVTVEAMAMERPVVAFAQGALPEIVADGETGLLVPPGDQAALAGAVVELLRDPERRRRLGRAGRRRAEAMFTARAMAARFADALAAVVWPRPPS